MLDCEVEKVMVLPSTVKVDPLVMAVPRSSELPPAVPTSWVAAVIGAAVLTAPPVTMALVTEPSRLLAVAPAMAVEVKLDLEE
jgi:hypothetical protein